MLTKFISIASIGDIESIAISDRAASIQFDATVTAVVSDRDGDNPTGVRTIRITISAHDLVRYLGARALRSRNRVSVIQGGIIVARDVTDGAK